MRPRGAVEWFVTVLSLGWCEYMASPNHATERTPKVFASKLAERRITSMKGKLRSKKQATRTPTSRRSFGSR